MDDGIYADGLDYAEEQRLARLARLRDEDGNELYEREEDTMKRHYPGYDEVLKAVSLMTEPELYEQIDILYGRDRLPEDPTLEELRAEVYRQVDMDWTDPEEEPCKPNAEPQR